MGPHPDTTKKQHPGLQNVTRAIKENPAKLKAFIHIPAGQKKKMPLVIALHGCLQTAHRLYKEAGWEKLSDSLGFAVLLPQQNIKNNPGYCYNWSHPANQTREGEEIRSILHMIEWMQDTYPIDSGKIFLYGLSAGACLSVDIQFLYPELFKATALLAGAHFGASTSLGGDLKTLFHPETLPDSVLLQKTPKTLKESKVFPRTLVFQGEKDKIIKPVQAENLVRQIVLSRQLQLTDTSYVEGMKEEFQTLRRDYSNKEKELKLSSFSIANWRHRIMIHPGNGPDEGGKESLVAVDGGFWSTLFIVREWGLGN